MPLNTSYNTLLLNSQLNTNLSLDSASEPQASTFVAEATTNPNEKVNTYLQYREIRQKYDPKKYICTKCKEGFANWQSALAHMRNVCMLTEIMKRSKNEEYAKKTLDVTAVSYQKPEIRLPSEDELISFIEDFRKTNTEKTSRLNIKTSIYTAVQKTFNITSAHNLIKTFGYNSLAHMLHVHKKGYLLLSMSEQTTS